MHTAHPFLCLIVLLITACSKPPVELGRANYAEGVPRACTAVLGGTAGVHDDLQADNGIKYNLRTPSNYDASRAHPVLVVYAAATHSSYRSEYFTGLTKIATAAGFLVAYAEHRRLNLDVLSDLASLPHAIAQHWCVDPEKIFVAGHSDGATAAAAIAFRSNDGLQPAALVASAAGIRGEDLTQYTCPPKLPVMILHGANDDLFPDFGRSHAQWWARCNDCAIETQTIDGTQCARFSNCAAHAPVQFCESDAKHRDWPNANSNIIDFLRIHTNAPQ